MTQKLYHYLGVYTFNQVARIIYQQRMCDRIIANESLVRISLGSRSCSVIASGFLVALKRLPDAAGTSAVQVVLEDAAARAEAWAFA